MYKLIDFRSRSDVKPNNLVFTGENGPWEVLVDIDHIRSRINIDYFRQAPAYHTKYLPFMPIKDYASFVSLLEGGTPLLPSKIIGAELGVDLWFKFEPQNPTGSFKDRGSAVDLSLAKEFGAKAIAVASTGNMAASCSCYAAAARLPCFVFVPEGTPPSKLSQVIAFGGRIVQVKGSYNDAARLSELVAAEFGFFLAGDYAFRVEGQKTAAYELIDQLFYKSPEAVVAPIGCGTNLAAYAKGFNEYRQLGFIDDIPKLIGVQASGACPVVNAFKSGAKDFTPLQSINTEATAIAVANPLDGLKALSAIYESNGCAEAVSDTEMFEAQYRLSRDEGLFVEASCASTVASLIKLKRAGYDLKGKIVCVLTAAGLKDPSTILKLAIQPPTIHAEVKEFRSLYNNRFFEGRSVSFFDRKTEVFSEIPTLEDINREIMHFFGIELPREKALRILETVSKFLKKGKTILFSDLQDIFQNTLENLPQVKNPVLNVIDFELTTAKDKQPNARVVVSVRGEERCAEARGVGPVDALISALQKACGDKMEFSLVSYKVGIRSEGRDAVTTTELRLKNHNSISVGNGASPDIIQSSIEAFESAYNGLF
jgi:threonine synthase